ncbi:MULTISPECIES: hypothetical protein [Bacillaceae]|uniref:hypothetical protein n=1 Tax=Bacillaceae TaxID=186817 RepID=UPI001E5ECE4B|nr:hypothetical protein [Bacillus sp. Au-Bac7]MCE4050822.1 hypothetical protein [Bacillus sp. Au-Bac7]
MGKNRVGIFAGKGQHEVVKAGLEQIKTLEEWDQLAAHVFVDRSIVISEMDAQDALFVLLNQILEDDDEQPMA